jgi:hypothetical protein
VEEDDMGRKCSTKGEMKAYRTVVGKPEGKRRLGRPRLGRWIILKWILERQNVVVWARLIWLRIGTGGELL